MKSICFISLGCPKNQVDSDVMLGSLVEEGYVISDDPSHSRIIIVNTCGFIEDAKEESIDTILDMAAYKKKGSCELLVVAGCLPQRYRDELAKSLPEVDLFIGVGEIAELPQLIHERTGGQRVVVGTPRFPYDHRTPRMRIGHPHAAYVKIAEGCFHACSFCIIPHIRGAYRSRPLDSIVEEVRGLVDQNVREINLIAQDTTAYGRDLDAEVDLGVLLRQLSDIPGDKWIRILYAYPHDFPSAVIGAMSERIDVVKYLDLPIQHVSERILKSMRREGDADEIRRLVGRLRSRMPSISLRTSVIVGYPGETDEEFEELLDFIGEMKFSHLGAFVYSQEEGTLAAGMGAQVAKEVAEKRRDEIMRIQQEISYDINRSHVGTVKEVLVEGVSEETEHLIVARHTGQAPDVDGVVYINEGTAKAGEFAVVEITEAHEYDLIARVL